MAAMGPTEVGGKGGGGRLTGPAQAAGASLRLYTETATTAANVPFGGTATTKPMGGPLGQFRLLIE